MSMAVQYAKTTVHECYLSDPACAAKVAEQIAKFYPQPFDAMAMLEKECGRYVKGAHKGQLRGYAAIHVVSEGGWQRLGPGEGNGRVRRPGTVLKVVVIDRFTGKVYLEVSA